jgi:arsenate reductase
MSTEPITLYHNPDCSKSRTALALLRQHGVEPEIVEYLQHPPDAACLDRLLVRLGLQPRQLMRQQESEYSELGLDRPELSRAELIRAMVTHPTLIERPIAVRGERACVGRPPENVLALL